MINSITVRYLDNNNSRVITNLGEAFVSNAIKTPPTEAEVTKRQYMAMPIRKKIFMHLKQYVQDMRGTNFNFDIN